LLPPISIAQYRRPLADTAEATAWHPPRTMFALCRGDCIHIRLAQASVSHPIATFSATAPARPTTLHEASVIETVAASHVICVLSRPRGHLSQG
jgi:hypothetical protein